MGLNSRALGTIAIGAVLSLLGSGVALADQVVNTLDVTADDVSEVMPLQVGGQAGVTSIKVLPANGDGVTGCNLKNDGTLTVSAASSNTSRATVSPSTLTFKACDQLRR